MHTINEGLGLVAVAFSVAFRSLALRFANVFGYGPVRQQHELFYQPVGFFALFDINSDGFCILVEMELHLLSLEIDSTTLVALFAKDSGEGV